MKKIILIAAILFLSTVSFAQTKGNSYVSAIIGAEFGTQKTTLSSGSISESESQPLTTSFSIGAEYGYFISNNLKLGAALYVPFSSTPTSKDDGEWLKNSTIGIGVVPNISYYHRINGNFYYTPEIGVNIEFGKYNQQLASNHSYNSNYNGWGIYLDIISFEFKISEKFALGVNIGSLGYSSVNMKDKKSDYEITVSSFKCNLNEAQVHARFYF